MLAKTDLTMLQMGLENQIPLAHFNCTVEELEGTERKIVSELELALIMQVVGLEVPTRICKLAHQLQQVV